MATIDNRTIVIVEDEEEQANALTKRLLAYPNGASANLAVMSPDEFVRKIVEGFEPDILFMDVCFADASYSGIDLVKRCVSPSQRTQVIYVTGFAEYCTPAYETDHTYFLLKPVTQETFNRALGKALENLDALLSAPLALRVGRSVVRIAPKDIVYIESLHRKALVHMADGATHESYISIEKLLAMLPHDFIQCHKSFLVNMRYVSELAVKSFVMETGATVPISQKRAKKTRDSFMDYMAGRACLD